MPACPGGSSADPTRYQTIWVTDRGAMVLDHDDRQAVVEREAREPRLEAAPGAAPKPSDRRTRAGRTWRIRASLLVSPSTLRLAAGSA